MFYSEWEKKRKKNEKIHKEKVDENKRFKNEMAKRNKLYIQKNQNEMREVKFINLKKYK